MNTTVSSLEAALATLEAVFPEMTLEAIKNCEDHHLSELHRGIGQAIEEILGIQIPQSSSSRVAHFSTRLDPSISSFYILRMLQIKLRFRSH